MNRLRQNRYILHGLISVSFIAICPREKMKAAADRGVVVTIRKDVLGTVFELGDMLNGKPSPVFASAGLKGHKNINRRADEVLCPQYRA
jgi:hypothetical protein